MSSSTRRIARIYPRVVEERLLKLGAEAAKAEVKAGRVPAWLTPMVNSTLSKTIRQREAAIVIQDAVRNSLAKKRTRKARRGGIKESPKATRNRLERMAVGEQYSPSRKSNSGTRKNRK
jgi:hypothetical protein